MNKKEKPIHYLGNERLKACGVKIEFTPEQAKELVRCSDDAIYFIETYCKIDAGGEKPFLLREFQKTAIRNFLRHPYNILNCARQIGKSEVFAALYIWKMIFQAGRKVGIFANKLSSAQNVFQKIIFAYERLPFWLQQGVAKCNEKTLILENGSKCTANATTKSTGRSGTLTDVLMDEFAFIEKNIADKFFGSVLPTISSIPGGTFTIVSTPNGMNHFWTQWKEASDGISDFVPLLATWKDVPERTEEWAEKQKQKLGEAMFSQEFECEFLGGEKTLIKPTALKEINCIRPIKSESSLDMFNDVEKDKKYAIVVDTATGQNQDYHAFQVIDITQIPYVQVAKFQDNELDSLIYPSYIYQTAKYYNEAEVLIELNNNGSEIAHILEYDLEYEHILKTKPDKKRGQILSFGYGGDLKPGVTTSEKVKLIGCMSLKSLVENKKLVIQDFDTVSEFTSFCQSGRSYRGDSGCHDDLVMCLVLFGWMVNQQAFKDITDTDIRKKVDSENQTSNFLPPVIITGQANSQEPVEVNSDGVWFNFDRFNHRRRL